MRATVMYGAGDVRVEDVPRRSPDRAEDALVRVTRAAICGTDLGQGVGLRQREGGPVEVIRPGDRVFFEPGENHWHGAAPTRFMTHIAIQQADAQGNVVIWREHVSDEQYAQAPSITKGEN